MRVIVSINLAIIVNKYLNAQLICILLMYRYFIDTIIADFGSQNKKIIKIIIKSYTQV